MNSPNVSPNCLLRSTTIAVCGIGMPSGCRNNAVTANQSASPPTIDASAVACTYSMNVLSPPHNVTTRKISVTPPSIAVARRFMIVNWRCLTSSERMDGSVAVAAIRVLYPSAARNLEVTDVRPHFVPVDELVAAQPDGHAVLLV